MEKFELKRTVQCKHCPWRVGVNPFDIPNGYCPTKHENLRVTIANEEQNLTDPLQAMACHHSQEGQEDYCVGWLHNQLGKGNNIALRIRMIGCANIKDLKVIGDQHENFEDTLPKNIESND